MEKNKCIIYGLVCYKHKKPIGRNYMAEKRYVYPFDEAYGLGKELLGGKGAGFSCNSETFWNSHSNMSHFS